jgi:hypothetical protein
MRAESYSLPTVPAELAYILLANFPLKNEACEDRHAMCVCMFKLLALLAKFH